MISAALGLGALSAALAASSVPRSRRPKLSKVTFESQMMLGNYSNLIRLGYTTPLAHWLAHRFAEEVAKSVANPGDQICTGRFKTRMKPPGIRPGDGGSRILFRQQPTETSMLGPAILANFTADGTRIYSEWGQEGMFDGWGESTDAMRGVFPSFSLEKPEFVAMIIGQLEVLSMEMERRTEIESLHARFAFRTPETVQKCLSYTSAHPDEQVGEIKLVEISKVSVKEYSLSTARDIHAILDKLGVPR